MPASEEKTYKVESVLDDQPVLTLTEEEFQHLLQFKQVRIVVVQGRGQLLEALGRYHQREREKQIAAVEGDAEVVRPRSEEPRASRS